MQKKKSWGAIKNHFKGFSIAQHQQIIKDLYNLNEENHNFLHARYSSSEPESESLNQYKKIITGALYPDITRNKEISLKTGKRAISDYKKATNDICSTLELMIHYIECGHRFTSEYGDIDAPFYNSLISMYNNVINLLQKHPEYTKQFYDRLSYLAQDSRNFGWGYDELFHIFIDAFPK